MTEAYGFMSSGFLNRCCCFGQDGSICYSVNHLNVQHYFVNEVPSALSLPSIALEMTHNQAIQQKCDAGCFKFKQS